MLAFLPSPLEQFEILSICGKCSVSNSNIYVCLAVGLIIFFIECTTKNGKLKPKEWQAISEILYSFIYDFSSENLGDSVQKYFPLIFILFNYILLSNFIANILFNFHPKIKLNL